MKFTVQHLISIFLAISTVAGCAKQTAPENAAQAAIQTWSQESVNHLLDYAPYDSPFILSSTHHYNAQTGMLENAAKPVLNAILQQFSDIDAQINESIQRKSDTNDGKIAQILKSELDNVVHLARNFTEDAPGWGLHSNGHDDYIVYISHNAPVLKFSAEDVEVFRSRIQTQSAFQKLTASEANTEISVKEIAFNDELWTIYDMTPIVCHKYNQGGNSIYEPVCQRAVDEHHYAEAIAMHFGKDNIVTTALLLDDNDAILPALLKKADAPLTASMLKDMADVHHFTRIKTAPLAELAIDRFSRMHQPQIMANRNIANAVQMARNLSIEFPSAEFRTHLNGNEVIIDSQIEVSDREQITNYRTMAMGTFEFSPDLQAGLQLSVNLHKTADLLYQHAKKYPFLKQISQSIGKLRSNTRTIDALHLEIKQLVFGQDRIDFDGKLAMYGSEIQNLVEDAYAMMGAENLPEHDMPRPQQMLDMSEMLSAPLNEVLRESEYTIASSSYDLNTQSAVTNPSRMLDFVARKPIFKLILSKYNPFKSFPKTCETAGISEDTCDKLPMRFLDLFDENAGIQMRIESTETALKIQTRISLQCVKNE